MNRSVRFWASIVAVNGAASLLAQFAFGGATLHTPVARILIWSSQSFVFSLCCSSLCIVVMPIIAPRLFGRFGPPFNWIMVAGLLVVLAAAGSLMGLTAFSMMGLVPARDLLRIWAGEPLKISIICTLLFGMFFTVVEHLRSRLDAARFALRTKERDEAEARRLAAESQLASLESRVHPHFLFNTLNSIAALIPDDPAGAERMTGQLASLLRSSLDHQATLVPLDEELRVVRNYLDIEQVRFGDRLRYAVRTDAGAAAIRVPRLAVQTLVENCVKYAVSPRREGASIAVRAAANNDHLQVEVEDNGPGFDASALPDGHGLALLRARLAMTFGDAASLRMESAPGRTSVTMRVPTGSPSTDSRTPNPESLL